MEARKRPESPECWHHFSVSSWLEVGRAHTTTCKQVWAKNYSRTKRHYLVKITSCMTYNHMCLSQKEPDKRKMIQNGSEKLTLKRNYNPRLLRAPMWRQSISVFSFQPSNVASGSAVMAAVHWFGLFPSIYDIRYISWLLLWNFWLLF